MSAIIWDLLMVMGLAGVLCVVLAAGDLVMGFLCGAFPRLNAWIDGLAAYKEDF